MGRCWGSAITLLCRTCDDSVARTAYASRGGRRCELVPDLTFSCCRPAEARRVVRLGSLRAIPRAQVEHSQPEHPVLDRGRPTWRCRMSERPEQTEQPEPAQEPLPASQAPSGPWAQLASRARRGHRAQTGQPALEDHPVQGRVVPDVLPQPRFPSTAQPPQSGHTQELPMQPAVTAAGPSPETSSQRWSGRRTSAVAAAVVGGRGRRGRGHARQLLGCRQRQWPVLPRGWLPRRAARPVRAWRDFPERHLPKRGHPERHLTQRDDIGQRLPAARSGLVRLVQRPE